MATYFVSCYNPGTRDYLYLTFDTLWSEWSFLGTEYATRKQATAAMQFAMNNASPAAKAALISGRVSVKKM